MNDKYGHDVGDIVIKQVGQMFANGLRKQDTVARWGGEEFLFMLPETSQQQAFVLAEKLRKKIESYEQKVDSTHLSGSYFYCAWGSAGVHIRVFLTCLGGFASQIRNQYELVAQISY